MIQSKIASEYEVSSEMAEIDFPAGLVSLGKVLKWVYEGLRRVSWVTMEFWSPAEDKRK